MGTIITLNIPAVGAINVVPVEAGQDFKFTFPIAGVLFDRFEKDLQIELQSGGRIVLSDFFVDQGEKDLPEFILEGGEQISGKEFLLRMDPNMDIAPAAGPSSLTATSSGLSEYSDDAGVSISGVSRLGALGTDVWSAGYETAARLPDNFTTIRGSGVPPVTPGVIPPVIEPPVPPVEEAQYHARLVVTNPGANNGFAFYAQNADGTLVTNPALLTVIFKEGASLYFSDPKIDPVTGQIFVALSAVGLAALQAGEKFEDFLVVTVNGVQYPVHLVGNDDDSYNYTGEEVNFEDTNPLKGEWYVSEGKLISGESIILGGDSYNSATIANVGNGNVFAVRNSSIDLTQGDKGAVVVEAQTTAGTAYALSAYNTSPVDIVSSIKGNEDTDVSIVAQTDAGSAYGVLTQSYNGYNAEMDITAGTVTVDASVGNNGTAYALYNQSSTAQGTTSIEGGQISLNARSENGTARTIYSNGVTAVSRVSMAGENISLTSRGAVSSYGILAAGNSRVDVSATGTLEIDAKAESYTGTNGVAAVGVSSSGTSVVNLSGHNVAISTHAEYKDSYAVFSNNGGKLSITAAPEGKLVIAASQERASTSDIGKLNNIGVVANDGAITNLKGSDIAVTSFVDGEKGTASAVFSGWNNAQALIDGYDDRNNVFNFTASGDLAIGLQATNQGKLIVNGGNSDDTVVVSASSRTDLGVGIFSQAGGVTKLNGGAGYDTLTVNAEITGTAGAGGSITGHNKGAYGIASAWGGAGVTVDGFEDININIENLGSSGVAFGMYTHGNWNEHSRNLIQNTGGGSITVTITVAAGEGVTAYAMYANQSGSNIIRGGSKAGDLHGDVVTLNGGMIAGSHGHNSIETGEGNDTVRVTGDTMSWSVGVNTIFTGGGNDIIYLDGKTGGVFMVNGSEGYDTLVLKADSYDVFLSRYGSWLKGSFSAKNVEAVHVDMLDMSETEQAALLNYFSDGTFSNTSITWAYGDTLMLDQYRNEGGQSLLNLSDFADIVDFREVGTLNLGGENQNQVTIDALFDGMPDGMKINGDANDKVVLKGDWQTDGFVNDGYLTYTHGDQSLHVRQELEIMILTS